MKKNYSKTKKVCAAILLIFMVSWSSLNAQTMTNYGGWGLSASALVDGTLGPGNQWGGPTPGWAQFQYSSAQAWNTYTITSGVTGANASAWIISGSDNGTNWTTLDTQSGVSWTGNNQVKTFTFSNSTAYQYYKFDVTGDDTGWGFFIGEFAFSFDTTVQVSEHKMNPLTIKTSASKSYIIVDFGKQVTNEKIALYDLRGSKVFETLVDGNNVTLNTGSLKNGLYIIKSSVGTARFIK